MSDKIVFPTMLKIVRKEKGITLEELGNKIGKTKSTISKWENGIRSPKMTEMREIAKALDVEEEYLVYGMKGAKKSEKSDITTIYNKLHADRQEKVYNYAQHQLDEQENILILEEYRDIQLQSKVSAGTGVLDLEPNHAETLSYSGKLPKSYDLAFQVQGDSMEPTFRDGEIIFVECMKDAINGAIMVVQVDEAAYMKKVYVEDDLLRLVSLNKEYKDIVANVANGVRIVGKVVF